MEMKSRLFQYKVKIPNVGETILFANSPAELKMKLRMSIMPNLRSGIEIERILPANAAKYFMDRRMKAYEEYTIRKFRRSDETTDGTVKNCYRKEKNNAKETTITKTITIKNTES